MNVSASPARNNGRLIVALSVVILLAIAAVSAFTYLVFIVIALAPAAAIALLERPGQRQATISVGSLTAATIAPLVIGAIAGGSRRDLIASAEAWSFVGAAALAGLAIYFILPAVAVWLADLRADARLRKLREKQTALEKDWGPEIRSAGGS